MHFHRVQGDVAQWGVYSWDGPQHPSSAWITDRFMLMNSDGFGGYVDIPLAAGKSAIWFLVTDGGGAKNCGADQHADLNADVATKRQEVWMLEGDCAVYATQPALGFGNLAPAGATGLRLLEADAGKVAAMVSGQFAIAQYDGGGNLLQVTSLQTAGLLDDLFAAQATQAPLGVTFDRTGLAAFRVWAPTAKSVALNLYASANATTATTVPMTFDPAVVVVFKVAKAAQTIAIPELKGRKLQLHRIQRNGSDDVVKASTFERDSGTFVVPARTAAVFVQNANDRPWSETGMKKRAGSVNSRPSPLRRCASVLAGRPVVGAVAVDAVVPERLLVDDCQVGLPDLGDTMRSIRVLSHARTRGGWVI